jgi:very-short-patch-repair endonuclease
MPKSTEFGEGECEVGMNIFINAQVKLSFPHFRLAVRCEAQMGEYEGGKMPRPKRSNPKTKHQAIDLRKESTPAERKLWSRIRNDQLGVTFRRQHAVGNYIPDFCSPKAKLIIELDGSQHLEQEEYDQERTKYLESLGYKVIRFWNNDVTNNTPALACWCKC